MAATPYLIPEISKIIQARFFGAPAADAPISYLLTDSRQVRFAGQSLFFALAGPHHDGHDFLEEAYQKGVRYFVVSKRPGSRPYDEGVFLLVKDTLKALQQLCRHHREQFDLPVIGITGSNGKTTVKEWLFQLLQEDLYILRNPRSYNSQVGAPLSVWPLRAAHQLGIFEAGISQAGEMKHLAAIIQPTIGLLTNIGPAHDAGFQDRAQKIAEKLLLFQKAQVIIYRSGEADIDQAMARLGRPLFTWSFEEPADLQIRRVERHLSSTILYARFRNKEIQATIPFTDAAALENAVHCWAVGLYLGLDAKKLAAGMAQLAPIAMRLELQEGRNGCTIINDSYNSDLQSLSIALDFAQQQRGNSTLSLILSDLLQTGVPPEQLYQEVGRLIGQRQVNRLIGVGPQIPLLDPWLPAQTTRHFFPDTRSLISKLEALSFQEETILIKGARAFAFEEIAQRLLPHAHRTVLEINLSALGHNLRAFHSLLQPHTSMMVMVKAAAYGGGSAEIARLLKFQGIRYLGVAYVDEGVALRKAGIRLPIMVLNPEPITFSTLLAHELEPEIYSLSQLRALAQFTADPKAGIAIHLKVDTGMHRLGFTAEDLGPLTDLLQQHAHLHIASVFSHLAASEDPAEDAFTHRQAQAFSSFYEQLAARLTYRPIRHLLNSAGIARFPQYQMEMVRLGIGVYGIEVCTELRGQLRPAFRLRTSISQIHRVAAGESIGYGRKGRAQVDSRIATLSIGYADGLLRKAGNGRFTFRLHGQPAPTIGNICMDMCMVDVTAIPEAREGDEVLVFGEELPIEQLAEALETIPYEVLTGISGRVKRVYIAE